MVNLQKRSLEPIDTSPLELEQLSDAELETILQIERRLYEAQQSAVEREAPRGGRHYLAHVQVRHPRVLLLDGGRGTGKTSLLLTLVHRWNSEDNIGVARHDSDADAYKERISRVQENPKFISGAHDFDIPTHVSVVGRILDFDPLPPEMPLIAGIIQAWEPLARHYDELLGRRDDCDDEGDTLMDLWHRLFRVAAAGWTAIPKDHGLLEQVLDRQEQVADWQRLDEQWRNFVDEVIKQGKCLAGPEKLPSQPVFVVMIDDVDLQVGRIRELLPALRLLYHRSVFFLVAADRYHMIDMLKLDFLGQQNRLSRCEIHEDALQVASQDRWANDLAKASFQKVFPIKNRWQLHQLSLHGLLNFSMVVPGEKSVDLKSILDALPQQPTDVPSFGTLGEYLSQMAGAVGDPVDLPPIMPYRTAHQIGQALRSNVPEANALEVLRQVIGGSDADDAVRVVERPGRYPTVEYRVVGALTALFLQELGEEIGEYAEIALSARPRFLYSHGPSQEPVPASSIADHAARTIATLLAVSLRDDGYGVVSPGLQWDARLALAWTWVRVFQRSQNEMRANEVSVVDLSFQWRLHVHPSPLRLLSWAKAWGAFLHKLTTNTEERLDRIAYAWIYNHFQWMEVDGATEKMSRIPGPFSESFNEDKSWEQLLSLKPESGTPVENARWRTRTLPLLARPEIGLTPAVQKRLLEAVKEPSDIDWLWDQRRRFVTDAIITAAEEAGVTAKNAEDPERVDSVLQIIEQRHQKSYKEASAWYEKIETTGRVGRRKVIKK